MSDEPRQPWHDFASIEDELDARRDFMMREGYRPCHIPACNCNSWHKAESRAPSPSLEEMREALTKMPEVVPTNWLDPLLTGPNCVVSNKSDTQEIEALLRAVKSRVKDVCVAALSKEKNDEE